jgi:hypothetical protein
VNIDTRCHQIQQCVGSHAYTKDFAFQQKIRKMDLAIKQLAIQRWGEDKAEKFFINGWGIVLGAAYVLEKKGQQLDISELYLKALRTAIQDAINNDREQTNPFINSNVWSFRMPILSHREGTALPSKMVEIPKTVNELNRILQEQTLKFELYAECRIYLMFDTKGEKGFFDKLWETDFSSLLKEKGFEGLERNKECPHATLIDSPAMSLIKKRCKNDEQFKSFFLKLVDEVNYRLKESEKPVVFTHFTSRYCENYPLFEEILVAKIDSPFLASALNFIVEEVKKEFNIEIPVADKSSYHVTVAVKPRSPKSISESLTLEDIIDKTGDFSTKFNEFLASTEH